jgi:hypothetical protein
MAIPTPVNVPVQLRAGRNIGIEPGLVPFVQDGASPETDVNPTVGSVTVILECPERMARTPQTGGTVSGMISNRTAASFLYEVYFRDDQGNDALLAASVTLLAGAISNFLYGTEGDDSALVLCPGEKIVLKSVPGLG